MIELFIVLLMIVFLYWLGGIWLPQHETIQQELMKVIEDE